ncbi:MAG: extracellular solute-binding protein [Alphaproteobacteria bacterium]|nr:extracellular solute-binding protein [Alphaproteobacteria bacterium]
MNVRKFRALMEDVGPDRRAFNRALAALGLGIVAGTSAPRGAQAAGGIGYFTWAGYEIPEFQGAYVAKYGGSPDTSFFAEEEEALTKIRAGFKPDVGHPCMSNVARWRDSGVIKPIDTARLRNWSDLIKPLTTVPGAVADGQQWIVPFDWGPNGIAMRTDLVDQAYLDDPSWMVLWDERYAGRLSMWDSVDGAVAVVAVVLGIPDTNSVTDDEFAKIEDMIRRQYKLSRFFWGSETDAETAMASGEIVATYLWGGVTNRLTAAGVPILYAPGPKEGVVSFACGLTLISEGPGDEQAKYDLIDAMTDPESGKYLIEAYGYGHSNARAFELVNEDVLKSQGLTKDIEGFLAKSSFMQSWSPAVRERYLKMFEDIKAG